MLLKMSDAIASQLETLFNITYLIQHSRPMTDFSDLAALHAKNGLRMMDQYTTNKQCREFMKYIAIVERQCQIERLNEEPCPFTVMLDASSDVPQLETVLLYIRYCPSRDSKAVTEFFAIEALPGADSLSYLEVFKKTMTNKGIADWKKTFDWAGNRWMQHHAG